MDRSTVRESGRDQWAVGARSSLRIPSAGAATFLPVSASGVAKIRTRTVEWIGRAPAAVGSILLLVGCGASAPSTRELTDQGEIAPIEVGWSEVSPAEQVELPTGKPLAGEAQQPESGQPVLINFWASTCKPCRTEMPLLQEFSKSDEALVIGVTRDRFAKYANEAIDRAKVTYPNYQDANQDYAATFRGVVPLSMIPVSVVVVDGKATRIHLGPFEDLDDLKAGLHG